MTREQEALHRYCEENRLSHRELADVFGYSASGVSAWLSGDVRVPPFVLLTIGFYAPVYQPEIDEVNRYRFKVRCIVEEHKHAEEDKRLCKANCGYASKADRAGWVKTMRKWCEMHGFIGKNGGIDVDRVAAYLNKSNCTATNYVYGAHKPPREVMEQIERELNEFK